MELHVVNETARLREVVLGMPWANGPVPSLSETFDSKSYESVLNGTYPAEKDIVAEMGAFEAVLKKYGVKVYRPALVPDCNQVFARDVGFVIDDKIIVSNIIPDRQDEIDAYGDIYRRIHYKNIYNLPETVHVEGGDVVLYNDIIFLGQYDFLDYPSVKTARTNRLALDYLNMIFPGKTIIPLNLRKSDTNPYEGILHLDCTFMPVGRGKAILYRDGFMNPRDADHLVDLFGPPGGAVRQGKRLRAHEGGNVLDELQRLLHQRGRRRDGGAFHPAEHAPAGGLGNDRRDGPLPRDLQDGRPPALLHPAPPPGLNRNHNLH